MEWVQAKVSVNVPLGLSFGRTTATRWLVLGKGGLVNAWGLGWVVRLHLHARVRRESK